MAGIETIMKLMGINPEEFQHYAEAMKNFVEGVQADMREIKADMADVRLLSVDSNSKLRDAAVRHELMLAGLASIDNKLEEFRAVGAVKLTDNALISEFAPSALQLTDLSQIDLSQRISSDGTRSTIGLIDEEQEHAASDTG